MKQTYTSAYDGLLEVTANDPSKTSAVTDYDIYGNVIRASKEMLEVFNHLTNGGFEKNASTHEGWTRQTGGEDLGTSVLTTTGAQQNRAITLAPKPSSTLPSLITLYLVHFLYSDYLYNLELAL